MSTYYCSAMMLRHILHPVQPHVPGKEIYDMETPEEKARRLGVPKEIYDMETPEEKARRLGVPVIAPKDDNDVPLQKASPVDAVCGECGMELRKSELLVCPYSNCPVRLLK